MSRAVLSCETVNALPPLFEAEGFDRVQVNAMSVDHLFALYERTGFLYPAKAVRLLPYMDRVRENWRRVLRGGESLLYVLTTGDQRSGYASVAVWRTTHGGWTWQHLVCEKNPLRSRAVMLGGLVRCMRRGVEESQQNWFRPENRFPARVFGSMVKTVGESLSSVKTYSYFALPRRSSLQEDQPVRIVPYTASHHEGLCALARLARNQVYVTAEDLDRDVELNEVDSLYRKVGLSRRRMVWLAYQDRQEEPVGAVLAYRGPLGLNFSFIENRCDVLLHPVLSGADATSVSTALLEVSSEAYEDFELDEIPVVADSAAVPALLALGGRFLRSYCQGIWLKDGQPSLYRHVDQFYTRLLNRAAHRRVQRTLSA